MKRNIFIIAFSLLLAHGAGFAQNIPQSQVPSVVLNHFKQTFPKAYDVEWEIKNNQYCAEFEMKLSKDHEACYDNSGKLLKHKEDVTKRKLPAAIRSVIKNDFNGYRVDDVKKITTGNTIQYSVELQSLKEELKVHFDEKGTVLKQQAD
ncbi:PepSY-like domain-containing protein [Agriterribacter sp.]|uniref:PepSY-like domain-containing protein n=1 Tax=Agriterribacter sp. TaxID=2821509 RepID=UPI002C3BA586|nr:PepSY-like domain-containing protein [Agriterribacter sp.]HRO47014.1 PepSY-like domain-containing protein [Agriterribacter sp.]HRQ17834.1 PepSY-like domain-containing protein [Agriterribacter sp.]